MSVTLERGDLLAPRRQEHQVTRQGLSPRADARDLRKASPFGRNDKTPPLPPLRLCAKYSEFRLRLCRFRFSAVKFLFSSSTGFTAVTVGSDSIAQRTPSDSPLRWNLTGAKRNLTVTWALPSNRYDPTKKQLPQRGSLALLPEPNPALSRLPCHQVNGI